MTISDLSFLEHIPEKANTIGGGSTEVNVSSSTKTTGDNYTASSSSTVNVASSNSKTTLKLDKVEKLSEAASLLSKIL